MTKEQYLVKQVKCLAEEVTHLKQNMKILTKKLEIIEVENAGKRLESETNSTVEKTEEKESETNGNTLEDIIRENSHLYVCDQQMDYGDQCDFTTKSKKDLKTHRKLYFECDICLFRTRSIHNVQELEEHMKKKHNLPEICTIFQCRCKSSGPLSILIEQG